MDLKEKLMNLNTHSTAEVIENVDQDITYILNVFRKEVERLVQFSRGIPEFYIKWVTMKH